MISLILNKKNIPYLIIAVLLVYVLMIREGEEGQIQIPIKENVFEVVDPKPEILFDTIYVKTEGVKEEGFKLVEKENPINKELLEKYEAAIKANDSLLQLNLYKKAITENTYKETFEDSVQKIEVTSLVVGTLKSQSVHYKTKPKTYTFKAKKIKPSVYIGGFVALPTKEEFAVQTYGVKIGIVNKKKLFSVGFDNKKNINLGLSIKLF